MMRLAAVGSVFLACAGAVEAQFVASTRSTDWTPVGQAATATGIYGYSDCWSTGALGLTNGGQIAWFQGFDTRDQGLSTDVIVRLAAAQGRNGTSAGAPAGSVGGQFVYDDPGGDHTDPNDLGCPVASAPWTTLVCCIDVKESVSPPPAAVSDGFWHVAMLPHIAGEFPAAFSTNSGQSNGVSWVAGSDTQYDPCDPCGGIGCFEMASLGFDSHWLLEAEGSVGVTSYCTPKSHLVCGAPLLTWSGAPQAGASSGFVIEAVPARGQRSGLMLYNCGGQAGIPFDGGYLCVQPTGLRRSVSVVSTGTNGQCDGALSLDWNAFASGSAGGNPDVCLGVAGQRVNAQWWGRDSPATGSLLSAGIEFSML